MPGGELTHAVSTCRKHTQPVILDSPEGEDHSAGDCLRRVVVYKTLYCILPQSHCVLSAIQNTLPNQYDIYMVRKHWSDAFWYLISYHRIIIVMEIRLCKE